MADEAAASYLHRPGAWLTASIRDAGIEIIVAELGDVMREAILAAQARQYR
ncbi:Uncharacterised protein [Mycobacterium tuberculosis]|nr:Uncharacterised protein [Mycobacterium tuberculosis]